MRNRAKCKKCGDILESFNIYDFVQCKCGEIGIEGGAQAAKCFAKDWANFLRIDDEGREIIPKIITAGEKVEEKITTKKELVDSLSQMVDNLCALPPDALYSPVTHYDFYSYMATMLAILRSDSSS